MQNDVLTCLDTVDTAPARNTVVNARRVGSDRDTSMRVEMGSTIIATSVMIVKILAE